MITEDYVSFETAKLLKEKGFEQKCDYATSWYAARYYKNSAQGEWFEGEHQIIEDMDDLCNVSYLSDMGIFIPAPTLQMTMKWLREEKKLSIIIQICFDDDRNGKPGYYFEIWKLTPPYESQDTPVLVFDTYEEACEAAIKYCLENLLTQSL